jgi:hypothetical protein
VILISGSQELAGEMKMKTMRSSILCLVVLLLAAPLLRAQDLSKYRHFTIGMNLNRALERTEQKMADVKVIHGRPALSGTDLVAAKPSRGFVPSGSCGTDSAVLLQQGAL